MSLSSPIVIGLIVAIIVAIFLYSLLVANHSKRKIKTKQKPNIKKKSNI